MKHLLNLIAIVAYLSLVPVGIASEPDAGQSPSAERAYVFVYLVLDHPEHLSQEEMGKAMQGHFDNMGKLAEEEKLLIAGPLAEPRISPAYRGIFVLNAETVEEGREIASTDPAVQAGVFKMEMHTFTTDAPLLELPQMERDAEEERLADPDVPDEWVGRMYVLAIGDEDTTVPDSDAVLISGVIAPEKESEEDATKRLLFVDAANADAAAAMPGFGENSGWTFYGWYGSGEVANLYSSAESAP